MRTSITTETLRRLPSQNIDIRDLRLPGFVVRCRATGKHSFRVQLGRGRWITIGRVGVLSLDEARQQARIALGEQAKGGDPIEARRRKRGHTLRSFLAEVYGPWQRANRKTGDETIKRLESAFPEFLPLKLPDISTWHVEKWRTEKRKRGLSAATINREVTALKAALNRAADWSLLDTPALTKVKPLRMDKRGVVRYLSREEEKRLREVLTARDDKRRIERLQANAWRRERGYAEYPAIGECADHFTPLVLLALNTGLRRGELFQLTWADIDLGRAMLTVRGSGSKNAQTRHVPLNSEAVDVLRAWGPQAAGYVFPSPLDPREPLEEIKKGWLAIVAAAKIGPFRFHDCRHHFASQLVQAGVDLNTVRELLGHADIKMVLRYAHLAPENTAAAVAKLVRS